LWESEGGAEEWAALSSRLSETEDLRDFSYWIGARRSEKCPEGGPDICKIEESK